MFVVGLENGGTINFIYVFEHCGVPSPYLQFNMQVDEPISDAEISVAGATPLAERNPEEAKWPSWDIWLD